MVKVEQVSLDEAENPLPRKPREWLLCNGREHTHWIIVSSTHDTKQCGGELFHVREVI